MLEAIIAAGGAYERSHGLGGLEEEEESRGGNLRDGNEGRVLPCFRIGGEAVGQVGEGCRVGGHDGD